MIGGSIGGGEDNDGSAGVPTSSPAATPAASRAYVTAFAPLVVRVPRRVASVGQWSPPKYASSVASATPPATAPFVTTHTLNLVVRASYLRSTQVMQRSLQMSVLPGPSFTRGSMAATADAFGAEAIGFEADLFSMVDRRLLGAPAGAGADASATTTGDAGASAATANAHAVTATATTAEEEPASFLPDSSDPSAILAAQLGAARLPGWGPVSSLRTMSGQHNENWILYSSGVRVGAPAAAGGRKIKRNVAIYTLLVHAYNDPQLAKAQMESHALLEADSSVPGSSTPRPAPLSMNALGVRLRLQPDFAIKPFPRNRAAMGPSSYAPGQMPMYMNPYDVELLYGSDSSSSSGGANDAKSAASQVSAEDDDAEDEDALLPRSPPAAPPSTDFATIVDFVCYQQKRFLFLGVAYSDGFLRIFSRNGTLRNEIHTRNETILAITMSNWGNMPQARGGGGGDSSNAGLNGANNGNQMLLYSTPVGLGLLKMSRIHQHVEQYCAFDPSMGVSVGGGRDISALAFDAQAHSIIYLSNHATRSLIVMSVRLGWNHLDRAANFDEFGLKRECPPTGCECHALASSFIPLRILPAAASTRSGARGFHPLYSMVSLRGFLVVASADSVAVFNSTQVGLLTTMTSAGREEEEVEIGVEFMFERSVSVAAVKGSKGVGSKSSAPLQLSFLQADRIDLLLAGALTNCLSSPCSSSAASNSIPSSVFAVFQSFLPKLDTSTAAYAWGLGHWLTSSRTPIFLLGLVVVLGWQWMQRRAQRKKDELQAMEAALGKTGFRRRNKTGTKGARGDADAYSDPDGEDEDELGARFHGLDERALRSLVAKQGGADPDTAQFMKDFLEWQQATKRAGLRTTSKGVPVSGARGNATMAGSSGSRAKGKSGQPAQYLSELAGDRARFNDAATLRQRGPAAVASNRSSASAAALAATKMERDRIQMRRKIDAMSPSEAAYGLGIGGFEPASSGVRSAAAAAPTASTAAAALDAEEDGFRALQAVARAAHDSDLSDLTDGMSLESQIAGVNYDSDDHPSQAGSEVEEELALQADEQRAARAVARAAATDALSSEDEYGDGPPHDGPFDDYSYNHAEFAPKPPQQQNAAKIRIQGGYSTHPGTRATDLIDSVNREEEDDADAGVDSEDQPPIPQLKTYPIDQPLSMSDVRPGYSYEQQLANGQAEEDEEEERYLAEHGGEDDEGAYGEEEEEVEYDEEGYAVPRGSGNRAVAAEDMTDAEREAEWRRLAAQARAQRQQMRGPAVPPNATVHSVGGFGHSVDDVSHYTDAGPAPDDDDLAPEDDQDAQREEWVDEPEVAQLQSQMQRTNLHEPALPDSAKGI